MNQPPLLIADSSTLLNFLAVDRLDLMLGAGFALHVVDAVIDEVQTGRSLLEQHLLSGWITRVVLEGVSITETAARFTACGLGAGEALSYAAAVELGCAIAIDDRRAVKRAAPTAGHLRVVTTADIVVAALRDGRLGLDEAESLRLVWERSHRFRLRVESFAALLATDAP